MSSNDFFMRQIEGMTDMLAQVLFGKTSDEEEAVYETQLSASMQTLLIDLGMLVRLGRLGEAEDLLFEQMEDDRASCYAEVARQLYDWMAELDDHQLAACGFPREEIDEGRHAVLRFYTGGEGAAQ